MTIVWWRLATLTSLQKTGGGEFKLTHHPAQSATDVAEFLQNISLDSGSCVTPFKDVATLSLCVLRDMEALAFHIKTLQDDYDSLDIGTTLDEDIVFLHTYVGLINKKLQTIHDQRTHDTLKTLKEPVKINVGSGPYPIAGWINIDLASCDLPHNVLNGLPFPDNSVAFAYSSYLLEHINYPKEASFFIQEIHRVLRPGGVFRVCVPNIRPYMRAYVECDTGFFDYVEKKWGFSCGTLPLEKVLKYAGSGYRPGVLEEHKFGYDDDTLIDLLNTAGFSDPYPCQYMNSRYDDLRVDLDPLIQETYKTENLNLIYECVK
jgi:SAM-dependent methyltransferase